MKKKSLDSLKGQKEALQQRLKAVQDEIRKKEAAKATREASQAKKTRTHALILSGSLLWALVKEEQMPTRGITKAAAVYYAKQIKAAKKQEPRKNDTPEDHAKRVQRQIAKLIRDKTLLISTIKAL